MRHKHAKADLLHDQVLLHLRPHPGGQACTHLLGLLWVCGAPRLTGSCLAALPVLLQRLLVLLPLLLQLLLGALVPHRHASACEGRWALML